MEGQPYRICYRKGSIESHLSLSDWLDRCDAQAAEQMRWFSDTQGLTYEMDRQPEIREATWGNAGEMEVIYHYRITQTQPVRQPVINITAGSVDWDAVNNSMEVMRSYERRLREQRMIDEQQLYRVARAGDIIMNRDGDVAGVLAQDVNHPGGQYSNLQEAYESFEEMRRNRVVGDSLATRNLSPGRFARITF